MSLIYVLCKSGWALGAVLTEGIEGKSNAHNVASDSGLNVAEKINEF